MSSSDDYLAMHILPQLASIGENLKAYDVHFYLAHSRISATDISILRGFAGHQCGITFHEIKVQDTSFYDSLVESGYAKWPEEAYYALLVQEILPDDVDRVLYIDKADFVSKNQAVSIPPIYWMSAQHLRMCEVWWKYASMTPIYEELDLHARVTANSWAAHFLPTCKDYNNLVLSLRGKK